MRFETLDAQRNKMFVSIVSKDIVFITMTEIHCRYRTTAYYACGDGYIYHVKSYLHHVQTRMVARFNPVF